LVRMPLLFLMSALPITPGGLGTTQAAAVFLFSAFAPGDTQLEREGTVLAYSLSMHALAAALQALASLIFARKFVARS